MNELFNFVKYPQRSSKNRDIGITSLIDKGLGANSLQDILNIGADYIDIVKFSFGSGAVIPERVLRKKIELLVENNCDFCFGGTLYEIMEHQNLFDQYTQLCIDLDFKLIEISDGAIPIAYTRKLDCIKKACDLGFTVLSEIGHKDPVIDSTISVDDLIFMASQELETGSWKVIIEARESGTVGLFNQSGTINEDDFNSLIKEIDNSKLIFEAPQKSQQAWLINKLGANVNLGNVAPQDVISLEALRQQLRADTICHD